MIQQKIAVLIVNRAVIGKIVPSLSLLAVGNAVAVCVMKQDDNLPWCSVYVGINHMHIDMVLVNMVVVGVVVTKRNISTLIQQTATSLHPWISKMQYKRNLVTVVGELQSSDPLLLQTVARIEEVLTNLEIPGYNFELNCLCLSPNIPANAYIDTTDSQPTLAITYRVKDVNPPFAESDIVKYVTVQKGHSTRVILQLIIKAIASIQMHELQENFKYHGQQVCTPHDDGKQAGFERRFKELDFPITLPGES